jgi:hypothetical protein
MRPTVVMCGSFHRDPAGLRRIFRELEATGCRILSPLSLRFTDTSESVVRTGSELSFSAHELEKYHLRAIEEADFLWLHAPDGYIGLSGAYEIGFATALQKPVFCRNVPSDEMLASQIQITTSVFEALEFISAVS